MSDTQYHLSIDIGVKNLAFSLQETNIKELYTIENIPKSQRYNKNGECTPKFSELLSKVYKCGKTIWEKVIDFSDKNDKRIQMKNGKTRMIITNEMLLRLNSRLDELRKIFDITDVFIIENQLDTNALAPQIQFHIRAYILYLYGNFKELYCIGSKFKTQILGASKKIIDIKTGELRKMKKTDRKKWAIQKAFEILTIRMDLDSIEKLENKKRGQKLDDICDTIIQLQAYLYLKHIEKIEFY